ncbi:MAG: hypothetical protein JWO06_1929 [Bacteroidota bacterium]|nr:hypothetical protein [Bacteroidota bacterium]
MSDRLSDMKNKRKLKVVEVKLGRERALGIADYENFNILVDPRQKPYEYLNTMVHELIHHMAPSWDESKVAWWANRLSRFLWSHNYRQVKQ